MYYLSPFFGSSRGIGAELTEHCRADNPWLSRIEPDAGPEGPAPVMSGPVSGLIFVEAVGEFFDVLIVFELLGLVVLFVLVILFLAA